MLQWGVRRSKVQAFSLAGPNDRAHCTDDDPVCERKKGASGQNATVRAMLSDT
jgi:hypothetical protein